MKILVHRGCSYAWPENTLQAFEAACHLPIIGIELDIRLTEPKYPVTVPNVAYNINNLERCGGTELIVNQPERYEEVPLQLHHGYLLDPSSGTYGCGNPARMASLIVRPAAAGSKLCLRDSHYCFAVATYNTAVPKNFIYTYSYDRDAAWVTYNGDYSEEKFTQQCHVFEDDCFFRVCLCRTDGQTIDPAVAAHPEAILLFEQPAAPAVTEGPAPCFHAEVADTVRKAKRWGRGCLRLAVLADSHYVTNGFWEDTVKNLRAVDKAASLDGILHLGDLTDGILPAPETAQMTAKCLQDLKSLGKPVLVVPGNHDSGYFQGNPEPLSEAQEQQVLYDGILPEDAVQPEGKFWYYLDIPQHKLRLIVLFSHDFRSNPRYGYPDEELDWLRQTLDAVPEGYGVLVLSHCPPLPELHYWSKAIRNGSRLIALLDEYNSRTGCVVLGFLHGHNHCEHICTSHTFPIISIGCAKCEYFTDKKPEGSRTEPRQMHECSQELWDVLLVDQKRKELRFIRFGAGRDRVVKYR